MHCLLEETVNKPRVIVATHLFTQLAMIERWCHRWKHILNWNKLSWLIGSVVKATAGSCTVWLDQGALVTQFSGLDWWIRLLIPRDPSFSPRRENAMLEKSTYITGFREINYRRANKYFNILFWSSTSFVFMAIFHNMKFIVHIISSFSLLVHIILKMPKSWWNSSLKEKIKYVDVLNKIMLSFTKLCYHKVDGKTIENNKYF